MTEPGLRADEPLTHLLHRLGPTPDEAGETYEGLRRLLQRFFEVRGRHDAESLADDVLDRLARRLADGTDIADVPAYARGVARLVLLEAYRRPVAAPLDDEPVAVEAPHPPTDDATVACLDRCLERLEPETRRQVIDYYTAEGRGRIDGRKRIAARLGVSATALRLRMLRARLSLERCVGGCLARGAHRNTRPSGSTS